MVAVQRGAGEKVRTDHLQAVAPRLVRPEHQSRGLDRLFDDRDLTLIDLEIDQLRRLAVLARQFPFHFPLELRLGHLSGFVQPGCTFETLALLARQLGQLHSFGPSYLIQLSPHLWWK